MSKNRIEKQSLIESIKTYYSGSELKPPKGYEVVDIKDNKDRLKTPYWDFRFVIKDLNSEDNELYLLEGWASKEDINIQSIKACEKVTKTFIEYEIVSS